MLPIDGVVAAYNLLLAVVWAALAPRVGAAPAFAAVHLVAASFVLVLRRRPRLAPAVGWLREYYPLLWVLGFWYELDYLLPLLHPQFFDPAIERLDVALFGASWSAAWIARAPWPWLAEPMCALYMLFPLVAVPPLWAGGTGRVGALRDVATSLTLCYLACCLVYLVVPALGPVQHPPDALARGPCWRLMRAYLTLGDSDGTAFPSYHVAAAVVTARFAWTWWRRAVAVPVTALAAGLAVSTVYTQHHYVLDAVAGLGLALLVEGLLAPALRRRMPAEGRLP